MAERTVNQRQLAVLRWIIDGCPDGVMTDVTYKTTAVALRNRRLVTISKKQGVWKAEATAAGKHFAEHGSYPENHWPNRTPRPGTSTSTAPRTTLGAPPTPLAPTAARGDRITGSARSTRCLPTSLLRGLRDSRSKSATAGVSRT
jgi:hypothetical protein